MAIRRPRPVESEETLGEKAAMPEAGHFPARDTVASEHRRQHQIHDVGFRRAEAARSGHNRNIVLVAEQEQIPRLYGSQEMLDVTSGSSHGAADDIVRPGGGRG